MACPNSTCTPAAKGSRPGEMAAPARRLPADTSRAEMGRWGLPSPPPSRQRGEDRVCQLSLFGFVKCSRLSVYASLMRKERKE